MPSGKGTGMLVKKYESHFRNWTLTKDYAITKDSARIMLAN
jgi:hypothetical protein